MSGEHLVVPAGALAIALAWVPVWWFARRRPGYSHLRDTISELGEHGAPDARAVAWTCFAPAGLAVGAFAAALAQALPPDDAVLRGLALFAGLGVGYIGAAIFPCDRGAPFGGTLRNHLHNLCGAIGYLGGAAGMLTLGEAFEDHAVFGDIAGLTRVLGMGVFFGILPLSFPSPVRGLVQRAMEAALFGCIALICVVWAAR